MAGLTKTQRGRVGELLFAAQAIYTSAGLIEPFMPAADDEEVDVCLQRRGQERLLYVQVKSSYRRLGRGRVQMNVKLNPAVFPAHPAFVYALLFIGPPGDVETAWLLRAGELLALMGPAAATGTTLRSIYPRLDGEDDFAPYRVAPADLGSRLLVLLDTVRLLEPPARESLRAFAAS